MNDLSGVVTGSLCVCAYVCVCISSEDYPTLTVLFANHLLL